MAESKNNKIRPLSRIFNTFQFLKRSRERKNYLDDDTVAGRCQRISLWRDQAFREKQALFRKAPVNNQLSNHIFHNKL
jgi:hypothetical protein